MQLGSVRCRKPKREVIIDEDWETETLRDKGKETQPGTQETEKVTERATGTEKKT